MNARIVARCLVALLPLAPAVVLSQEAFTRQAANVRAGPDRSYPLVAQLGPGAPLRVMGCLEDWTWCDVAFDDNRGWVYGPFLLYGVPDDRVPLYTYGPSLGIAIIGFSLGGYWDEHYRQRPWYGGRSDWERRAPPQHHVPEGLPPHAVYTPGMHPDRGDRRPVGRPAAQPSGRPDRGAAAEPARGRPAQQQPQRAAPAAPQAAPREHAPAQQPAQHAPAQQPAQHAAQSAPQSAQPSAPRPSPPRERAPAPQRPQQAAPAPQRNDQGRENAKGNPQHAEPQGAA